MRFHSHWLKPSGWDQGPEIASSANYTTFTKIMQVFLQNSRPNLKIFPGYETLLAI
jgi:hypothetical protein